MIDSHTHLDHAGNPDIWIENAIDNGVKGIISIGCGIESIKSTIMIAQANVDHIRVAVGIHPQMASSFEMSLFNQIEDLAQDPLVVAIGEAGFDQFHDYGPLKIQDPLFIAQCELARELKKPLIIHTRDAELHTLKSLEKYAYDLDVILHCFSFTDQKHIDQVLEKDRWFCSFAGNLTYPSADGLRAAATSIPLDRLLVETDAPYLAPKPMRGKRNEPAYIQFTLKALAELKEISFEEADFATSFNASRVFNWVPSNMSIA